MKFWITKYALTSGIFEAEGEICESVNIDMIKVNRGGRRYDETFHGEGKDWHKSVESANYRAMAMRDAKIISLEKQINKLKNLKFN
jgi:hypothetical protein